MNIQIAHTQKEIIACYAVMVELRPHLSQDDFLALVERMHNNHGYDLVYLDDNGIKAVAGIRIAEWLYTGKYLEIDDLITTAAARSQGYGAMLFDWVADYARENHCVQLRLVSGVQRIDAHRFYENKGMKFEAKYFSLNL
ncbi:GNAT family N-acetyltransferase [Cellvibrio sp. pealriver]|uniref:GNAT family N-acetyltransferase n=1 Tax=Cellvibrio sp. pealriver TaxID=1622269 RepID=UPI00066FED2D|nr:GNAT family N-acetyltransferase [Cellvibrio sp. pealriver]